MDRDRSLSIERQWLDHFVSLLPAGDAVLDIGCGHGEPIAKYLIANGYYVTGVDTSETFISSCQKRFPDHQWRVADMRTLEIGKTFQGLVAWDSLFHLTQRDQRRMFKIFEAHAAPGAVLLFTSGPSQGERIGTYRGEPLYHASLSALEYSSLLRSNGFCARSHVVEDPDSGSHTVWLAQQE